IIAAIAEDDQRGWPSGTKTTVCEQVNEFFEEAEFLGSLVEGGGGADPLEEDWQWARQPMLALLELAQEFTAEFTRAKRELGGVDFADLEQLALQVLRDRDTGEPTPTAQTWRAKF